jgi:multidrug efflux pump subunit AcrA (membrane-fusion protein)
MIAAAAVAAWLLSREHQAPAEERSEAEKSSVVAIETVPIKRKTISEKVIAYGSVIAQPGKTYTVSVAFESHINHVLVAAGQLVGLDDPLVEIEASPATDLLLRQAQNTLEIAQRELTQTQERFRLKLATNQELNQAQKTARDAELQLQTFQQEGVGSNGPLRAKTPGVVATVAAQDGQIAAAGSALVEIVASDAIEVKLGIEAEEAAHRAFPGKSGVLQTDRRNRSSGDPKDQSCLPACRCLCCVASIKRASPGRLRSRGN